MDNYLSIAFADMVANLLQNELCSEFDSGLLHAFMGIASEAGELLDKYKYMHNLDVIDTLVELSDLLHFTQMLMGQLNISLVDVVQVEKNMHWCDNFLEATILGFDIQILQALAGLSGAAGELLNRYKKFIYYHGEPFTREEIGKGLVRVIHYILVLANLFDSSIDEIIVINMAKLKARYPNGYSHDKAITHKRDKKKERAEIIAALKKYRSRDIGFE